MLARWMLNSRLDGGVSAVELENMLQLNTMRECLQNIWLSCHQKTMEESPWPYQHWRFEHGGRLAKGWSKTLERINNKKNGWIENQ